MSQLCCICYVQTVIYHRSSILAQPSWTEFLRPYARPSDSFSSLWAAFTLTVHINALFNESIHGKEEHATWINTIPLKISHLFEFSVSNRWSQRDSLGCLRLNSRYGISLFDSNHFICDTSPLFSACTETPSHMFVFDKRQFYYNRLFFWLSRSTRVDERTHV